MKELKVIGTNIARRRQALGLTQTELCRLASIDRSFLSEIENGKMNVSVKALVAIADVLECDLADLVRGSGKARK